MTAVEIGPGTAVSTRPRTTWFVGGVLVCLAVLAPMASRGMSRCAGFVEGGAAFTSTGELALHTPQCLSIDVGPNSALMWILVVIAIVAVIAARHEPDGARGQRILDRTLMVVALVAVASVALTSVWWSQLDLTGWEPGEPVPITTWPLVGDVDVTITDQDGTTSGESEPGH